MCMLPQGVRCRPRPFGSPFLWPLRYVSFFYPSASIREGYPFDVFVRRRYATCLPYTFQRSIGLLFHRPLFLSPITWRSYWIPGSWNVRMSYTDDISVLNP